MSTQQKAYIAGIGMITSVGANTAMTAASVNAGISGYQVSTFFNQQRQPITMSAIPSEVYTLVEVEIEEGAHYSIQYDHIIKMAVIALREAISSHSFAQPIPLVLAIPEDANDNYIPANLLITNLLKQKDLPLRADRIRFMSTGRAAGIQGLELALHYLYQQGESHVLLGGSDSYWNASRIYELDKFERLLASNRMDGFAPGEGAGFLLLSRDPKDAMSYDNYSIALSQPGNSQEVGHYYSEQPYRGDGLDQAFKQALSGYTGKRVQAIYTSMNGENHWAKEYGVAYTRNKAAFSETVKTEHPADCFGDLGAAMGPVLLGLAASSLFKQSGVATHLVYSSSDRAWRAAVRMEKLHNIEQVRR